VTCRRTSQELAMKADEHEQATSDRPFDWRSVKIRADWSLGDLTPEQQAALARLPDEQRRRIGPEMTAEMRRQGFARIRRDHPEWLRHEVAREWVRLAFLPDPMPEWLAKRFDEDIAADRAAGAQPMQPHEHIAGESSLLMKDTDYLRRFTH
jgi:hypothetical protein